MTDSKQTPDVNLPDAAQMTETLQKVTEQSQRIFSDFLERQKAGAGPQFNPLDPGVVGKAFGELTHKMLENPQQLVQAQIGLWQDWMNMTQQATLAALNSAGGSAGGSAEAGSGAKKKPGDKRFKDQAWQENPLFGYIADSYLLVSRHITNTVQNVEGLDDKTAEKVNFYTQQFVDAMSPSNFAVTNPAVLKRTMETGGQNLVDGLSNLLDDLERGEGKLKIRMTDIDAFELGENVAVTPGKVVYQNELMQLIQYSPATDTVYKRPLLIVPPWINKFYILDLRAKNSFIKWAVDQGHTVFVISWVNPDEKLSHKNFDDYLLEGPMAALDAIEQATGEKAVKAIGYCLGGTLLAAALAYMSAQGDDRIKAATFFTTMIDFSEPGELGVFIDRELLEQAEKEMDEKGYFEGANMAEAFNLLRANDLIWSFVVNNYLMGKDPFPFDLLYWNSDSTRMPRDMHRFYLRSMYEENLLAQGGISLDGVPIDLSKVETPCYFLSTVDDHIAPWTATYKGTQLVSGPVRFVLGGSGHIAGVINPPAANKYGYRINQQLPAGHEEWLAGAEEHEGSWWTDWRKWVSRYNGGKKVAARQPGEGGLDVLEDAPGSYVKNRL